MVWAGYNVLGEGGVRGGAGSFRQVHIMYMHSAIVGGVEVLFL